MSAAQPDRMAAALEDAGISTEAAMLGRELKRISIEDACALMTAEEWEEAVIVATRKAFPADRAAEILFRIGRG